MPVSFMAMANTFAQEIKVSDSNLKIKFDPRKTGVISSKIQNLLKEISHPQLNTEAAYSFTID